MFAHDVVICSEDKRYILEKRLVEVEMKTSCDNAKYMWVNESGTSGTSGATMREKLEVELEDAEFKTLRFSRKDTIKNDLIRGTTHVRCFGDKVIETKLRWLEMFWRQ